VTEGRQAAREGAPGTLRVLRAKERAAVVELEGEHDLGTSRLISEVLDSLVEANELVVADLSETTFVDSSVILALVGADRSARTRGSRFRLQFGTAPIVRRALEITGVLEQLEVVATREEALRDDDQGGA
jgi:anti-anti-sigma factor